MSRARKLTYEARTLVRCGVLYAPAAFMSMPLEHVAACVNGCGAAGAKFDFVPDTIWGIPIGEACAIHDFMYHVGMSDEDKQEADRVFLNNLLRLIAKRKPWYIPAILPRRRARKYYLAVKYFGGPAFWAGKN